MTSLPALLGAALALGAAGARAADEPPSMEGRELENGQSELVRRAKDRLTRDPETADALAARILRSSLGAKLASAPDSEDARAGMRDWIAAHPDDAAQLAVGFARDDAEGSHSYEASIYQRAERFLELNPDRNKGLLGRLDGLGAASKALRADKGMSDDDRRKLMKEMFEGRSTVDQNAGEGGPGGHGGPGPGGASPVADGGLYERLSAANPTGYSPQVQALQSELNRSAPPGAPHLVETGKLDYPTLVFPAHAVRYDLDRLESDWAREAAAARAASLGEKLPIDRLADPAAQKDLEARAAGKPLPEPLVRRRAALERTRAALDAFEKTAAPAKTARAITTPLLRMLSARRRDAAAWVQVASLEQVVSALEGLRGFMDAAFKESLARCPVDEGDRAAYLAGGAKLDGEIMEAVAAGRKAIDCLSRPDYASCLPKAQTDASTARAAARRLPDAVSNYRSAPDRLAASAKPQARWRAIAEDAAIKYLPSTSFARDAAARRKTAQSARADFARFLAR